MLICISNLPRCDMGARLASITHDMSFFATYFGKTELHRLFGQPARLKQLNYVCWEANYAFQYLVNFTVMFSTRWDWCCTLQVNIFSQYQMYRKALMLITGSRYV